MPVTPEQRAEGWVSVTEVLDTFIPKGLLSWYLKTGAKEAKRLSTVAMKIGSRVDELIQQDITNGSYKLSSKDPIEVKNCMEAWLSFKRDYQPNIVSTQMEVTNHVQKVVGHIDIVWDRIIDVKCASSIKDNYWIQTSKYDYDYPGALEVPAILRLDKNLATYEYKLMSDTRFNRVQCVKVFDGLLEAYRFYNEPKAQEDVCQTS